MRRAKVLMSRSLSTALVPNSLLPKVFLSCTTPASNSCHRYLCSDKKSDADLGDSGSVISEKVNKAFDINASPPTLKKESHSNTRPLPPNDDGPSHTSPYRIELNDKSPLITTHRDANSPYIINTASAICSPIRPLSSTSDKALGTTTKPGSSASPEQQHSRVWHYTAQMNNSLKHIEQNVMNRIRATNRDRLAAACVAMVVAITGIYTFREEIGVKLKSMTTGLALETLEDKAIKIQTEELARAVVQTVLNDKEVTAQAASFLKEASHAPETQEALLKLTLHVLKHPDSLHELSFLTKNVLNYLAADPDAIKHLAILFSHVFQDSELKQHLNMVASDICKSPEVIAAATELTAQVFKEPVVQEAVNDILIEGSSKVIANEELAIQSRQFVADVMGDDSLQREGGNALWNSIYHAVVPGSIRFTGFSLICLSLGLGGLMLSPY